ncbi:nucleoid-associated protein YejK [Bowmanella sp. JS7-9]|uniref:Nucleoid-associated protein YejK n=1 Tax=Pseudobowmanella zhangzhouensis TaxID=1537679 RepID=A0ABW1XJC2_9ALTE|nr:nucleoid-associated protein YejK [Bowmanella sp. JS7-9]TBX23141.1 nucleoid-associated protein [Bowmanella sp. JS7-9]
MSVVVHHCIVHQLQLDAEGKLVLQPRNTCLDISPQIEQLTLQMHQVYAGKPGKGVGGLVSDEADSFPALLDALGDDEDSFLQFSQQTSALLTKTLVEFATIETGFIVFTQYQYLATEFLLIGLLNTKQHVEIDASMQLNVRDHLDLAKMQLAARIDLTERRINADQNRYVSFIKGRAGRKVSDFFLAFLSCEELVDIKKQNKELIAAVDDYLAVEQLDVTEKQQTRAQLANYYKEKIESGEDIQIKELAEQLPKGERDFIQFTEVSERKLEQQFQPDPTVVRSLSKFSGAGGGVTIAFDRKLLGERVQYDPHSDTLLIKGVPPNLKDQLNKANSNS